MNFEFVEQTLAVIGAMCLISGFAYLLLAVIDKVRYFYMYSKVVRCKDCKNYSNHNGKCGKGYFPLTRLGGTDYCSRGFD